MEIPLLENTAPAAAHELAADELLSALVDWLVTQDADRIGPALLVQKNTTDAVVVLRESFVTLVLLSRAPPETDLEPVLRAALAAERQEVLAGIGEGGVLAVVVSGAAVDPSAGWLLPAIAGAVLGVSPAGAQLLTRKPESEPGSYQRWIDILSRAVAPGGGVTSAPRPTVDQLQDLEREGEAQMAAEGIYASWRVLPLGVVILTSFTILVYLFEVWWRATSATTMLALMGANQGRLSLTGQWDRLIVGGYLHANVVHIVSNMALLVVFGPFVEAAFGFSRFLVLYTALLIGSEAATAWFHPEQVGVGASGALLGLLGSLAMLSWRSPELLPPISGRGTGWFAALYLAVQLVFSLGPAVSLTAHLAGGLLGLLLVATGVPQLGLTSIRDGGKQPAPAPLIAFLLACLCFVLTATAFWIALTRGRPWDPKPPSLAPGVLAPTGLTGSFPVGSVERVKVRTGSDFVHYQLGDYESDLLVVSIVDREHAVPDHDGDAALQHLEGALASENDRRDFASPRIVPLGSRRAATVTREIQGVRRVRYLFGVRGREVDVELSTVFSAGEEFQARGKECLLSLDRPEGQVVESVGSGGP